jgi:hypothetical protein
MKTLTWRQWLHGLLAVILTSLSTLGGATLWGLFRNFELDWNFFEPLLGAAFLTGWPAVQLYMHKFPPPGDLMHTIVTDTEKVKDLPDGGTERTTIKKTETTETAAPAVPEVKG